MTEHVTHIPPDDLDRVRRVSEAIFGAKHRLPMAVVIDSAPPTEIYARGLASAAGTTEVQAANELRHFARAGLLELLVEEPVEGKRGRPPKRYTKRRSHLWTLARRLADEG
jgi:hypothetical protein